MNDINFDPNIDQIVPIGFYTHPSMHRCNLIYPIKNKSGWFFPKKWFFPKSVSKIGPKLVSKNNFDKQFQIRFFRTKKRNV